MAAEEVVGGIVGFLRLDAADFHREITRAIAEVKVLKGMDARVRVEAVGARKAEADLGKVAKSALGVQRNVGGMNKSFRLMSPQVIIGGLVAGMSLLGPLTAAAAGAMGGFVGVAGTGVLAYQGFKKEIEDGTALGVAMQGEVDGLGVAFDGLGTTAARAMSGGVLAGLGDLRAFLPTINDDVEILAGNLGDAFRIGTGGVISGLQTAMPLLQDGGRYAEILAQKFADFAASDDFKSFVDYARRELPNVGSAMADLAGGVKDLAVGLAPVGEDLVYLVGALGKAASAAGWFFEAASENPLTGLFLIGDTIDTIRNLTGQTESATTAVDGHSTAVANLAAIQSPLASGLGTTNSALSAARDKHADTAQAAEDATLAMQLEGDAAGLLKQQLDLLNGKALDLSSAQTSAADSTLSLSETFKENGTTLSLNTEKGVENRRAIERKIAADQALAEATAKATGSTVAGTESLKTSKGQLEDTLRSQGKLTDKVQAYIDKLYAVPKDVPPTRLEVETKTALDGIKAFQTAIDKLHGKTVTASIRYAYTGRLPSGGRSLGGGQVMDAGAKGGLISNGIRRFRGGGLLSGPGTGTSDSILAGIEGTGEPIRVANGEFISTDASRRKNRAALEAGNKGATLAVQGQTTETTHAPVIIQNLYASDVADIRRKADDARWQRSNRGLM